VQTNDETVTANTQNEFFIEGDAWLYMLRVDGAAASGKNYFDSTGKVWIELDDCDISGGNSLVVGSFVHMRLSNGTRIHNMTSSVFAHEYGYVDTDGLCHIHGNAFVAFFSKGKPVLNLDNCDSKDDSDPAVDEANTNGVRCQGSATSVFLDSRIVITSADKILTRPTSGLIFKGTSPPSSTSTYYERGATCFNEAAAAGETSRWRVITKGYGGSVAWEAEGNITATTTELEDATDAVNTVDKVTTRFCINTTTGKTLRASGTSSTSTWVDMDGVTQHTPS
jgi:hypothetical protein